MVSAVGSKIYNGYIDELENAGAWIRDDFSYRIPEEHWKHHVSTFRVLLLKAAEHSGQEVWPISPPTYGMCTNPTTPRVALTKNPCYKGTVLFSGEPKKGGPQI